MTKFAYETWTPVLGYPTWYFDVVANLPALIDGMCLYLAQLHG